MSNAISSNTRATTANAPLVPASDVEGGRVSVGLTDRCFTLRIDTARAAISNPYGEDRPSDRVMAENRRKSVARLLRVVALMLEQGRDIETIRDHTGGNAGSYTIHHDRSTP